MTHSHEKVHFLAVPPSFRNDHQLSKQSSAINLKKKQRDPWTHRQSAAHWECTKCSEWSGHRWSSVEDTHGKLVKQHADISSTGNSRNVCNCLFFLSKRHTVLHLMFSVLNLYFNIKSNSKSMWHLQQAFPPLLHADAFLMSLHAGF